jgi:hypothetical protein
MATGNMVPYSNPAGHNQTTPSAGVTASSTTVQPLPGTSETASTATSAVNSNPLIPATTATTAATNTVPSVPSAHLSNDTSELSNIFGSGVGNDISSFLASIGGTDSTILQEYVKSLQPQLATAQAQTNAALGAGGVSANSSVAAIADANLGAQETAAIAGEEAKLTQSGLQMQEQMIQGMEAPAENYTAEQSMMPWEIAGSAIGAVGSVASAFIPHK